MPIQSSDQRAATYRDAGVALPTATSPISVDKLTAPALSIPTYTPPPATTIAPPAPIDFGVAAKQTAVDTSQADLKAALDQQGNEAAVRTQLETAQGVPDINKQLNELYSKDAGYQSDLSNIASEQLQKNNVSTDRLAPTFAINGEQAQIARQAQNAQQNINIQRATNAALITAAQGRLSTANDYIQKALDAQFTPLASQIDYLKTVLTNNQNSLSTAEQNQLQSQITDKTNAYNAAKDAKTQIYNVLLTASQNGADNVTLQKIQNAATPELAIAAAGNFTSDPTAKAQALASLQLTNAQIKNTLADAATKAAAIGNNITATTAEGLTSVLGNSKISATTKTNIGNIIGVINSAETLAKANPDGSFKGISPLNTLLDAKIPFTNIGIPFRNALRSNDAITNTGTLDAINLRVQQWASGASLTKDQIDQVNKLVPTAKDTDATVRAKLNTLVNNMNDYIQGDLAAEGVTYDPAPVDLFAKDQSLSDIFNQ